MGAEWRWRASHATRAHADPFLDLSLSLSRPAFRSKKVNKGIGIAAVHFLDDQLWQAAEFV